MLIRLTCVTWSDRVYLKRTVLDISPSFCLVFINVLLLKGGNIISDNVVKVDVTLFTPYTVKYIDYKVAYSGDYSRLKLPSYKH